MITQANTPLNTKKKTNEILINQREYNNDILFNIKI